MSSIEVQARLDEDDLVRAVGQLGSEEFDRRLGRLLALRARRNAPVLPSGEADLLLIINRGLPESLRSRYGELAAKRDARSLTPEEYAELLRLTGEVEAEEGNRAQALAVLARLRGRTPSALLQDLGIPSNFDA